MGFEDKLERLESQQDYYNEVISKRHPSDVHCPNCDKHLLRLQREKLNIRKIIELKCPDCNGDINIVYDTNQLGAARSFTVGFNLRGEVDTEHAAQ